MLSSFKPFNIDVVMILSGKMVRIEVDSPNETIEDIQAKIQDMKGIPPEQQRTLFSGRQLEPHHILANFNIHQTVTFHQIPRFLGGGGGIDLFVL